MESGIIYATEEYSDKYVLRANAEGQPTYSTKVINGIEYKAVTVEGKTYIPNN